MSTRERLIALSLLAASLPGLALAQTSEEALRLHLSLGPDGRIELSTSSAADAALAEPATSPGPLAFDGHPLRRYAINLSASTTAGVTGADCAGNALLRLGPLSGCDWLGSAYNGLPGAVRNLDMGLQLSDSQQRLGLDFRYGLGWLDSSRLGDHSLPGQWLLHGLNAAADRGWSLPAWSGVPLAPFTLERMALGGFIGLGDALRLHLGYEHAEGPLALFSSELGASWASGTQDSVSLGIGYGRFYGGLTGRQLRPADPMLGQQGASNSLDLGFSWRMPWNAELEFGARNLITNPAKPETPERSQQGDLRTPYLRYHQEL